jgi:hypothetical protein
MGCFGASTYNMGLFLFTCDDFKMHCSVLVSIVCQKRKRKKKSFLALTIVFLQVEHLSQNTYANIENT